MYFLSGRKGHLFSLLFVLTALVVAFSVNSALFQHKTRAMSASRSAVTTSGTNAASLTVYIGSKDYNVYALNARTGAKLWSYTTGDIVFSPAVVGGLVYIGSYDHNIYALNAKTGAKVWSFNTGGAYYGGMYGAPAFAEGMVYVGSHNHKVYGLNAKTGALIWSYTTGGASFSSPAVG